MTSLLCIIRSIADIPRALVLNRPRISGHRYVEQERWPDQAYCVMVLKCETCGDELVSWSSCQCRSAMRAKGAP